MVDPASAPAPTTRPRTFAIWCNALAGLGFDGAQGVRQGKVIEMKLSETDEAAARATAEEMCKKLLANPVMENYSIEILA